MAERVSASMANPAEPAQRGPDPVVNSDRGTGTTPPESTPESTGIVGRPGAERPETEGQERKPFNEREALEKGGSFDAIAPPGDQPPS